MPEEKDEDYDGVDVSRAQWKDPGPLRWNRFKWTLFCTNIMVRILVILCLA